MNDFQLVETNVQFRYTVFEESPVKNVSTHILIDGLTPVEEGSLVVTSTYRGVNIEDGAIYDFGQVLLTLPAGSPVGEASSAIVGIVERDTPASPWSGWSAFDTNVLPNTQIGVSNGVVEIDPTTEGTLTFSFNSGDLVGTADYFAVDESTLEVAAFTLTRSSTSESFHFAPMEMTKGSYSWYGVMLSTSAQLPDDDDSLMYQLRISGWDVPTWGGYRFVNCPEVCGWVNATSDWLGYLNIDSEPLVYNFDSDLWMHMLEPSPKAPGGWAYIYKRDTPDFPIDSGWGGYETVDNADGSRWVNSTANWMGHLNLDHAPFYYWHERDLWVYIPSEPEAAASGAWFYVFKR